VNGGGGTPGGGVNTPVWGGLGMFCVGDIDGVGDALDVVVVVVEVAGALLPLLPQAAVSAPAAMIAAVPTAAAMRPALNSSLMPLP
jgi:hypothetical protein